MVEKNENWFRRYWVLAGFLVLSVLFVMIGAFNSKNSSKNLVINYEEINETGPVYQKQISEIEHKYNIDLEYKNPPNSSYSGSNFVVLSPNDEPELAKYVAIFYKEFNKYPQDFIKNINLRGVAFVKNLSVDGQYRAAEPDFTNEVLFYDIYLGNDIEEYQKETINHEFYHMIEEEINGDGYYENLTWVSYEDLTWASFNDPNFKYGSGGALAYDDPEYAKKVPETGFISVYSTYDLEEDKAEVFTNLMVPELAKEMYSKAVNDSILDKKVKYMKDFLSKHSDYMNEDFWQNILNS